MIGKHLHGSNAYSLHDLAFYCKNMVRCNFWARRGQSTAPTCCDLQLPAFLTIAYAAIPKNIQRTSLPHRGKSFQLNISLTNWFGIFTPQDKCYASEEKAFTNRGGHM